ncbi:hypothetical protein AB0I84_15740 [Streptomyces spectabilis]|uniref:hypothetical protein n=1 Tax=Streptomyces spectabilis TaxID=68270 RepID=UPI0033D2E8E3
MKLQRTAGASNKPELVRLAHAWGLLGPCHPASDHVPPSQSPPRYADLVALAEDQIRQACRELWPEQDCSLLSAIPSSTGIVRKVRIGKQQYAATCDLLAAPLAELLLGIHGSKDCIRAQMDAYLPSPHAQACIQERQQHLLAEGGLPVPTAAVAAGVLFTSWTSSPTASDLLKSDPARAMAVMTHALSLLPSVLTDKLMHNARDMVMACPITQGLRRLQPSTPWAAALADSAASRLHPRLAQLIATSAQDLLPKVVRLSHQRRPVYGALQPDHIVCPDPGSAPMLLSPALHYGAPGGDVARLISRTTLEVLAGPRLLAVPVTHCLRKLVSASIMRVTPTQRGAWLYDLLQLWFADTLITVATSMISLAGMPPSQPHQSIKEHLVRVQALLAALRHALTMRDPQRAWLSALHQVDSLTHVLPDPRPRTDTAAPSSLSPAQPHLASARREHR